MPTSHKIKSIQVEGGFLTGSKIVFDDHLNCLIGGRGTGKTTVLELIRYVLGFTPDSTIEPVKAREFNKLISANLGDASSVTLEIETLNGLKYTVKRKGGDEPPVIKDDAGSIKQIDFRRSQLFDAEIYSQNDIENAASNPRDQLNIVDRFREDDLNDIAKELSVLKRELEDNAIDILSMMSQSASLQDDISEIDGVSEKLKAFDIEAGENPEEVSQQGAKIQAVAKEQKAIGNLLTGLADSEDELSSWLQDLERLIDTAFTSSNLSGPNRNQIEELRQSFNSAIPELRQHVQSTLNALSSLRQDSDQTGQKIENQILTLQEEYDQTLARHQEVKGKVQERDKLQKLYVELLAKQTDYDEKRDREAQLIKERHQLIEKMSDLCDRRCNVRKEIADSINKQLSPMIRVTIVPMGNPEEYQSQLSEAMKHSQMQYAKVVERIVLRIPPPEFAKLVQNGQVEALMEKLEIDQERANKIIAQLQNTREIFDLEMVELYDLPLIELKDGAEYKAADKLSTGQKCTTILPILLLESIKPLLIDQPEDNLDNAFVYETVVKSIRKVKENRQLIFVTHNPNIPVLGDAEKVFVLKSDGQHGEVISEGNVDKVKVDIETILEGGKDAFEERRRRYGH